MGSKAIAVSNDCNLKGTFSQNDLLLALESRHPPFAGCFMDAMTPTSQQGENAVRRSVSKSWPAWLSALAISSMGILVVGPKLASASIFSWDNNCLVCQNENANAEDVHGNLARCVSSPKHQAVQHNVSLRSIPPSQQKPESKWPESGWYDQLAAALIGIQFVSPVTFSLSDLPHAASATLSPTIAAESGVGHWLSLAGQVRTPTSPVEDIMKIPIV